MNSNTGNYVMAAYDVTLNGERIDTVFFHKGTAVAEVWDKLVMHDHYDPDIVVEEVQ
jgi:hypothetical protein